MFTDGLDLMGVLLNVCCSSSSPPASLPGPGEARLKGPSGTRWRTVYLRRSPGWAVDRGTALFSRTGRALLATQQWTRVCVLMQRASPARPSPMIMPASYVTIDADIQTHPKKAAPYRNKCARNLLQSTRLVPCGSLAKSHACDEPTLLKLHLHRQESSKCRENATN